MHRNCTELQNIVYFVRRTKRNTSDNNNTILATTKGEKKWKKSSVFLFLPCWAFSQRYTVEIRNVTIGTTYSLLAATFSDTSKLRAQWINSMRLRLVYDVDVVVVVIIININIIVVYAHTHTLYTMQWIQCSCLRIMQSVLFRIFFLLFTSFCEWNWKLRKCIRIFRGYALIFFFIHFSYFLIRELHCSFECICIQHTYFVIVISLVKRARNRKVENSRMFFLSLKCWNQINFFLFEFFDQRKWTICFERLGRVNFERLSSDLLVYSRLSWERCQINCEEKK